MYVYVTRMYTCKLCSVPLTCFSFLELQVCVKGMGIIQCNNKINNEQLFTTGYLDNNHLSYSARNCVYIGRGDEGVDLN